MERKNDDWAVEVDHVSIRFNLGRDKMDNLKEYLIRLVQRRLFYDEFWALKDVSFRVRRGGMFGLIGLNGAGKSTMLKVIAGVMKPTKGTVQVSGVVAPLIELGAGFDDELTATENVFLNGAVLGYNHALMQSHYNEIMDFAELWEFQHVPLKNFSSGMRARLAFAIATMVQPDILIADEILSVGDYRFQEKCMTRIQAMIAGGTTVLLVSHAIRVIRDHCEEAVWFEKGEVRMIGPAAQVCDAYSEQ